jgi:hypothetical protein
MSGYQVSTPNWFAAQAPQNLSEAQLSFLQEQFWRPEPVTITRTAPTAENYLQGYIVYQGATGTYATPTATEIIDALQVRLTAIHGTSVIPAGFDTNRRGLFQNQLRTPDNSRSQNLAKPCFSFQVMIDNESSPAGSLVFTAGSGVTISGSMTIASGSIGYYMITIEYNEYANDLVGSNLVSIAVIA